MLINVTFSISPLLLRKAREKAVGDQKTLNALFRDWVENYVRGQRPSSDYKALMAHLKHVDSGRTFSREELNER
jgi:hypothetical protein